MSIPMPKTNCHGTPRCVSLLHKVPEYRDEKLNICAMIVVQSQISCHFGMLTLVEANIGANTEATEAYFRSAKFELERRISIGKCRDQVCHHMISTV